ncbi:MAG TPA: endonuclease NucS domain-containing protein [Herpetosiphonaceae bacterium]
MSDPAASGQRPFLWQMIKAAVEQLGGAASYAEIRDVMRQRWGAINDSSVSAQIMVCSVNQPSRIHFPENHKPRRADSRYDFLYSVGRGQVELYDPARHGAWEIARLANGKLGVRLAGAPEPDPDPEPDPGGDAADPSPSAPRSGLIFALESHLRDFLARNLSTIQIDGQTLRLYVDEQGRDGVEYRTGVGPIDILAVDGADQFVVFELKLSKGVDAALGQILRYMGWVRRHLAGGRAVRGVIVAQSIDEKLRYAAAETPGIALFAYDIHFTIQQVPSHEPTA